MLVDNSKSNFIWYLKKGILVRPHALYKDVYMHNTIFVMSIFYIFCVIMLYDGNMQIVYFNYFFSDVVAIQYRKFHLRGICYYGITCISLIGI